MASVLAEEESSGPSSPESSPARLPRPNPVVALQLGLPAPLALLTLELTSHGLSALDRLQSWTEARWGLARMPSPSFGARKEWAERVLGLTGDARREWARRSWWGHAATQVVARRLHRRAEHEAEDLVDPIDWRRVDELHAAGRGLLVIASHLGDEWMPRQLLASRYPDVSCIVGATEGAPACLSRLLLGTMTPESRMTILASARARLRRGGVVVLAADGLDGERGREVEILGHKLELQPGAALLARLTRAPCVPVVAAWHARRLRLTFGDPIEPDPSLAPLAWENEWIRRYVRWLERWAAGDPENVRLNGRIGWLRSPPSSRPPNA